MRSSCRVPMLAAVATLAGVGAAPAYAFKAESIGGGGPAPRAALVEHHASSSPDWVLIGAAAVGGVTLVGVGVGATRRLAAPTARTRRARPAGGA
jgi:hypothetical protein